MNKPRDQIAWGWYNFGNLVGVERRRKTAIAAVENHVGKPWKIAKNYMQVRKVIVKPIS